MAYNDCLSWVSISDRDIYRIALIYQIDSWDGAFQICVNVEIYCE